MGVYSKAQPHVAYFEQVAEKYNLPSHLLLHQVVAEDNEVKNPQIAENIALSMKRLIDQLYFLRTQGVSWRDIYGLAASAFKLGTEAVFEAVKKANSMIFADVSKFLPAEVVKYVAAPRFSVYWDYKDWTWFDKNYKQLFKAESESAIAKKTSLEPIPAWVWFAALGAFFLMTRKK